MDYIYNDNEEKTLNIVNTLNKGVWRGDTRSCEQGEIIKPGKVVTRPINMNEVDNKTTNDLNQPIGNNLTNDQPITKPVTIPNDKLNVKEIETGNNISNNKSSSENHPIRYGFANNSQPIRLSLTSSSESTGSENSKTTWGQVKNGSPQKTCKEANKQNSKSPHTSPTKNKNSKAMTSWKDISPTKLSSSSDLDHSGHSNPSSNEYANRIFRFSTNRMKDFNDSSSSSETEAGDPNKTNEDGNEKKVTNKEPDNKCTCTKENGSPCKNQKSCNCSNNCTSHLPDNQNSLVNSNTSLTENGSPKKEKGVTGSDDMCDNEYFYEDDFTVQFDTNLRETSVTPIDSDPGTTILDFPNMVSGSYLHFNNGGSSNVSFNNSKASSNVSLNNMRASNIVNNQEGHVQYDSEFSGNSGSHNSTMEMSSSDRDMMASSDMIELSDGPLFTPTPTHLLTDSLDKNRDAVEGEMSGSDGSGETNLNVDCCPRKEEYFLSFDGSHSRVSGSETDISLSMTSHESYPGQLVYSEASITSHDSAQIYTSQGHEASNECSSSEGQEESTDSFHMCFNKLSPRHKNNQYAGRENLSGRILKKLVPVKETIIETGDSSEDENTRTSTTLTAGSKDLSASPQFSPKKKVLMPFGDQISQLKGKSSGQLFLVGIGKPEQILKKAGVHSHTIPRVKKLVSWRQLKNYKKGEVSKCSSLPDINTSTSWQNISALKCRKLSEISQSFHSKRHSASLLEFYQRMKSQSNPVSPETMNNLEHILWPNFIGQKAKHEMSDSSGSSQECAHCQCGKPSFPDDLPDSGLKGYSKKRIFDWLKMEGSGSTRPSSLACQTGNIHDFSTKETLISPQTVTLWCGTKTVASQFPPVTKDCAIQTFQNSLIGKESGLVPGVGKRDQALQTSDFEEEEILSILSDNFEEFGFLKSNEGIAKDLISCPDFVIMDKDISNKIHRSKSADGNLKRVDRASNCTNKSYQQKTSHIGRSKSTGRLGTKLDYNDRRMGLSKHYSHISLPDIAFLSSSISIPKEESKESLFDAMKLDLPVPVTIVPKTELEQFSIYKQTTNSCSHHKAHCKKYTSKVKGSDTEIGSSSSGISTSSASSGIDPGYCDCRSRSTESPENDLERLIFFPPHTEEKIKSTVDCCGSKKRAKSLPSRLSECANPNNPKIEKYANETRPQVTSKSQTQCRISEKWINNVKKVEPEGNENLYALEEEQTPVASPDQPCCHIEGCCGDSSQKSDGGYGSEAKFAIYAGDQAMTESDILRAVENEKIIVVGNDYYRGLSMGLDSNSSSGSSVPNVDRKPLKSCLRKRNRGLRSRSMSATDTMTLNFDDLTEKVKNHRHSYGCDEVYIVSDEHGQLMMYQADDSAEPVMFYLGKDGECHMTEGHRNHLENFGSLANFNIQASDSIHGSDSSTDREGSNKRKSVSFASEVSFQSISPTASPKWQGHTQEAKNSQSEEKAKEVEKQEVPKSAPVAEGKVVMETEESKENIEKTDEVTEVTMDEQTIKTDDITGSYSSSDVTDDISVTMDTNDNLWFEDVMMEKIGLLMSVSKAATHLYSHFNKSKDTFDKLRLGNTAETPELGEIVLTRLCTALTAVLGDGLKHHLAGFQMFGSVQITVWKVVEASVEIVPQTRSLCDLVQLVKQTSYLSTHQQKFDAFVFGLLNLRVLDFWLGYLRQKDEQLSKFYSSGAILVHANKALKKQYDDLLVSIQRLAVLPFHMDMEFIKEKALSDSKFKSQEMIGSSEGGYTTPANQSNSSDPLANQNTLKAQTSVLELTATKALNWLTNATMAKKRSSSDLEESSGSASKSDTIDSANQMTDSNNTDQMNGSLGFDAEMMYQKQEKKLENLTEKQQQIYKDAKTSAVDCDPIISQTDSLRSSQSSQTGFVSLFSTMAARLGENQSGQQSLTSSMTSSASSLVTRLTGIQFGGNSQKTYKKGVTEYKFAEDVKSDKMATPENESAEKSDNKDKSVEKDSEVEVKLRPKTEETGEKRDSKRVSFDIVNLFDKLLLPSAKPEKKDAKPVSRIPVPTNRWSWSFGISKPNTTTKLPKASTDTDLQTSPKKTVTKNEQNKEHFPKRNNKPQNEKITKGGKSAKTGSSTRGSTNVSAPPKPPRLVQSAPSNGRKILDKTETQSRNTSTL
ncbi:Rab GTPase binding [Mactra antiquata]